MAALDGLLPSSEDAAPPPSPPWKESAPFPSSPSLTSRAAICGLLNNAAFCVLLGASQEIANEFGRPGLQPLLVNLSTTGSLAGVFTSSLLLVGRVGDASRLLLVTLGTALGYAMITLAYILAPWERNAQGGSAAHPSWGFWLCAVAAFLLGFVQSIGEVLNLALYRSYTPSMLASWGAGTGVSGVAGPFLFLALHDAARLHVGQIALVMSGFAPLYLLACGSIISHRASSETSWVQMQQAGAEEDALSDGRRDESVNLSCSHLGVIWNSCKVVLVNMVAVYALEYMINSGFMQVVTSCSPTSSWMGNSDNNNPLLWAMYNVGVTLSRASVSCFRIRRVWILTLLQALNVLIWAVLASTQWVVYWRSDTPLYLAAAHMVFVGFMGGACYSNCMYLFNTSSAIPNRFRELGINLGFFFTTIE
ncbi:MAG: hypothetical protein SGPRY_008282 [Prymnesium sp.]